MNSKKENLQSPATSVSLTCVTTVIIVRSLKHLEKYLGENNEKILCHKTFSKNYVLLFLYFMFYAGIIIGHHPVNMVG